MIDSTSASTATTTATTNTPAEQRQRGRSVEEWEQLCESVRSKMPAENLGEDAWVVVMAATLITSPSPDLLGGFWTHLTTSDPRYQESTPETQQRLSLRFRDVLLKLITLVGAPQVLSALMPLAKAQGNPQEKADRSVLSEKWKKVDVDAVHARGVETINSIYGSTLLPRIFATWGNHKADVVWNELFSVYGMYLSDFEHLTALETEAVVYASISCLGLPGPGLWHLRGMGRLLGARGNDDNNNEKVVKAKESLRGLKTAVMAIVDWVGEEFVHRARLSQWANVGDIGRNLGGWGDDEDD